RKETIFYLLYLSFIFLLFLVLAEVGVRYAGFNPCSIRRYVPYQKTTPSSFTRPDDTLGWVNVQGRYRVDYETGHSFEMTYLDDSSRMTSPPGSGPSNDTRPEIWVFGASVTQAWSVNDNETFCWVLQEKMPGFKVRNFGHGGYGILQSQLLFRKLFNEGKVPGIVVLMYSSYHDDRNTFTRSRRKALSVRAKTRFDLPVSRIGSDGKLVYSYMPYSYTGFPFRNHSALSHFLEQKYNDLENIYMQNELVTRMLIQDFSRETGEEGVKFMVVGFHSDDKVRDMIRELDALGVTAFHMPVDIMSRENINYPHDGHPNKNTNHQFAKYLEDFIMNATDSRGRGA
ncbi:hypothetical protein ACFLRF_06665, partial [Candidatus Altiarchaeota archaeon]